MDRQETRQIITETITINAPASKVWEALTKPELMKKWMLEEDISIITDWRIGHPIVIKGNAHWVYFENGGTVLQFEPERILRYNHLSSLSNLPDLPENYSLIEFRLMSKNAETILTLTLGNFPTESIYKHIAFYWPVTLKILKQFIEKQQTVF